MADTTPYIAPIESGLSTRARVLAVLVALALIGGIVGAVLVAKDGGGNSPEDAVRKLATAAQQRDGIGVIEALLPSERDAVRTPVNNIVTELKRLQVIKQDADLRHIPGVDTTITGLTLSTQTLADNVADVSVTGGKVTVVGDAKQITGSAIKSDLKPQTQETDLASKHIILATVKESGRWYVSLAYSVAEAARRDAKQPPPPFGHGVAAKGTDSPEAAVRDAITAATSLDVRRLIELTPPDEMAALHDYAPLFIADAEKAAADAKANGPKVQVTKLDLATTMAGDRAHVAIKGFTASWTSDGKQESVAWDGKCITITPAPEDLPQMCAGGNTQQSLPPNLAFSITTVQRNGAWYISPVGTLLDMVVSTLKALPTDAFKTGSPFNGLIGGLFGAFGTSSSSSTVELSPESQELHKCLPNPMPAHPDTAAINACMQKVMGSASTTTP
jgi:hypothetical protein